MTIYRLVTLRKFLRSWGKCTICFETSRLRPLHDQDYRHGICGTCKDSYNKNECHMCRKPLKSRLRPYPGLYIDTSMSPENEALLNDIFNISDQAVEQQRQSHLDAAREDLEAYINNEFFSASYTQVLRRIRRNCLQFLDFDVNRNTDMETLIRGNLSVSNLLYIIDESLNFKISYEYIRNILTSGDNVCEITAVVETIYEIENCLRMIWETRFLPGETTRLTILKIRSRLTTLQSSMAFVNNFVNIGDTHYIELQSLYDIVTAATMEDMNTIKRKIFYTARIHHSI